MNVEGRIHLDVVVTDRTGKPVTGLEAKDFVLLDNKSPSKILSFHAYGGSGEKPTPPPEVIVVLDSVNERHRLVEYSRQQIEDFLRRNGGHLAQPTSVFLVTNEGVKVQPHPSTDGNALAAELHEMDIKLPTLSVLAGGNTAVERFTLSVRMLTAIVKSEAKKPGRKLLLWAGLGWPMVSGDQFHTTPKAQQEYFNAIVELSTKMRQARITLYSIAAGEGSNSTSEFFRQFLAGIKSPDQADAGNLALKVLAVETGGRILGPNNDLTGQAAECSAEAGSFYSLSFNPPPAAHPDEYHDLKLMVEQPGLTVRANTGYYNQP